MPVIGYLGAESPELWAHRLPPFHQGLAEVGFIEGRNVVIEYRWAHGHNDRLPALAAELINRPVSVIAAPTGRLPDASNRLRPATLAGMIGGGTRGREPQCPSLDDANSSRCSVARRWRCRSRRGRSRERMNAIRREHGATHASVR